MPRSADKATNFKRFMVIIRIYKLILIIKY
jgi:hypothetical protein